jgi:hypothetical protein
MNRRRSARNINFVWVAPPTAALKLARANGASALEDLAAKANAESSDGIKIGAGFGLLSSDALCLRDSRRGPSYSQSFVLDKVSRNNARPPSLVVLGKLQSCLLYLGAQTSRLFILRSIIELHRFDHTATSLRIPVKK